MPVVMTAAAALLALKTIGLATHTSYLFVPEAQAAGAKAAETPPEGPAAGGHEAKEAASETPGANAAEAAAANGEQPKAESPKPDPSPSERALLEALQKRRETLEGRASDLDMRENLLKAAERRMEERLGELRRIEAAIAEADERRAEEEKGKLKELVAMYEAMKVKEAARIFDKLDPGVLLEVASRMKPQTLSAVMGQMAPEAAQRLTVALARRDTGAPKPAAIAAGELPKIEGRPTP